MIFKRSVQLREEAPKLCFGFPFNFLPNIHLHTDRGLNRESNWERCALKKDSRLRAIPESIRVRVGK